MGGSASCSRVVWPKMVHGAADGHDGEGQEGGHRGEVGRQAVDALVGPLGEQRLLEDELDAVGERLSMPKRPPARSGPIRFCMSEMILRSNQIMSSTRRPAASTKVIDRLDEDDQHDAAVDVARQQRIGGERARSVDHETVSIRMSVTAR